MTDITNRPAYPANFWLTASEDYGDGINGTIVEASQSVESSTFGATQLLSPRMDRGWRSPALSYLRTLPDPHGSAIWIKFTLAAPQTIDFLGPVAHNCFLPMTAHVYDKNPVSNAPAQQTGWMNPIVRAPTFPSWPLSPPGWSGTFSSEASIHRRADDLQLVTPLLLPEPVYAARWFVLGIDLTDVTFNDLQRDDFISIGHIFGSHILRPRVNYTLGASRHYEGLEQEQRLQSGGNATGAAPQLRRTDFDISRSDLARREWVALSSRLLGQSDAKSRAMFFWDRPDLPEEAMERMYVATLASSPQSVDNFECRPDNLGFSLTETTV